VLVVASVVLSGITVGRFTHALVHTDARFFASGRHGVVLPAHERRGLYLPGPHARGTCRILDSSGRPVPVEHPHRGSFSVDGLGLRETFDTGDGHLVVACHTFGVVSQARIGSVPTRGDVARVLVVGFAVPALLGLAGLTVLIVTAVLRFSRRPPPGVHGVGPPPRR
jgi:hypothetical protein